MAISYDQWKKSYESMDDSQKQQYNDAIKNKGDDYIGNQYMKQYNNANSQNQNGTNGGNQTYKWNPGELDQKVETQTDSNGYSQTKDGFYTGNSEWEKAQNREKLRGMGINSVVSEEEYARDRGVSPDLDMSKFGATDGKVNVKEGTAAQTGMPDYQLNSDARMNEIVSNLNAYRQNNPEFFKDRNTFNQMFHYSERDNEQKALLDTYWKKKLDMDNASKYNTGDSINNGMKDADITPDQLNYIKEYSPEAYREWQQKQLDDINLRIANLATPADPTDTAELFNSLVNKLGLDPGDPYQIYDNWYSMCERLGVFSDSEKLKSYQNQLDQNHSEMEGIMSRYSASTGGTVSDALAAARMSKALAPYQQREVDLQNSYTTLLNGRNSNLAVANQSANALAMQAAEDQRVWSQRLQGLNFAMATANFRTPEQQAQLQLQTAQIQGDLNLLNQAKANDLNLYNQYATVKLQNQLQQELTDLSVEDEAQLKANLNNALSTYYQQYGDIIKRSQAQAVDDIIAYAKKNGISVAEAMTKNFIEPLQNKAEYKQKIASSYGMLSKQSIGTINGRSVIMTTNPNGTISYKFIDDNGTAIESTYKVGNTEYVKLYNGETMTAEEYNKQYGGNIKAYNQVDSRAFTADPISTGYEGKTLYDFLSDPKNQAGNTGGQCAAFVNRYLESIGVGKYYGLEDVKTRESRCNSDTPQVGTIAVFDYNHYTDGKNYGHVAIVTKTYADGSFDVIDSNYDTKNPGKITKRHINAGTSSLKGFFDPSQPPSSNSYYDSSSWRADPLFEYNGTTYDFTKYSGWQELTDDEWITVQNLLTYQTDPKSLPKSGSDNGKSNTRVRAAAGIIGRDAGYNEGKFGQADKVIKQWETAAGPGGSSSANSTAMSILYQLYNNFSNMQNTDLQTVNKWINDIKRELGDPTVGETYATMSIAASELAKALKGNASATSDEIKDWQNLLTPNMGEAQAREIFKSVAQSLYDKNESEAKNFGHTTGYKPDPIWTDSASEWMAETLGIDLSTYYNYTSSITTGPEDIREMYFSGLYNGTPTSSNINFILNG